MKSYSKSNNTSLKYDGYIGFLEYSGEQTQDGLLDARKSAKALLGFDRALRFLLEQEQPILRDIDFEIPVRVQPGSWLALIPDTIGKWIITALGVYITTAASKMASKDFKNIGFNTLFRKALNYIQWHIKLGKHLGTIHYKDFTKVQWRNNNQEIGIKNEEGEILFVPKEIIEVFINCPDTLLTEIVSVVDKERELRVGIVDRNNITSAVVTEKDRHIFFVPEKEPDVLFPEFEHGKLVNLRGLVTRGNENTNSIGFEYQGHILTCFPRVGSIVRFKPALFLNCIIIGVISRADEFGGISNSRPKIIFDDLITIEKNDKTSNLFENN